MKIKRLVPETWTTVHGEIYSGMKENNLGAFVRYDDIHKIIEERDAELDTCYYRIEILAHRLKMKWGMTTGMHSWIGNDDKAIRGLSDE